MRARAILLAFAILGTPIMTASFAAAAVGKDVGAAAVAAKSGDNGNGG